MRLARIRSDRQQSSHIEASMERVIAKLLNDFDHGRAAPDRPLRTATADAASGGAGVTVTAPRDCRRNQAYRARRRALEAARG
jgi:hypothetical protein